MIVSIKHRFVFLSVPKCASTAIEAEIADLGEVVASGRAALKHTPYRDLERFIFPFLEARLGLARRDFCVVALIRHPVEWLHSWFRYRTRAELGDPRHPNHARYTGDMTFQKFANDFLRPKPGGAAKPRPQAHFLTTRNGRVGPDALFRYESIDAAVEKLESLTGRRVRLQRRSVSPRIELVLGAETRKALERAMARDFEIYGSLASGP